MRTSEIGKIVLKTFVDKEFYGYDVHKRLASLGVEMEMTRLYRILNGMLREGLLESRWERSRHGPEMRMYRLAAKGREELQGVLFDAIETVHYFYTQYLSGLPPEIRVFSTLTELLASKLKTRESIAYVTERYSQVNRKVLAELHIRIPEARIHFIKPRSLQVDLRLGNSVLLNGSFEKIPLKDDYVDLVIIAGVPRKDSLEVSLNEAHRIMKRTGTLAIITPTVLIQECREPLTIGDFIEKYESRTEAEDEYAEEGLVKALLGRLFWIVEERQIAHLTVFIASEPYAS